MVAKLESTGTNMRGKPIYEALGKGGGTSSRKR